MYDDHCNLCIVPTPFCVVPTPFHMSLFHSLFHTFPCADSAPFHVVSLLHSTCCPHSILCAIPAPFRVLSLLHSMCFPCSIPCAVPCSITCAVPAPFRVLPLLHSMCYPHSIPLPQAFSPDSRWLVSSSMDCSLRTWDLPSGRPVPCTHHYCLLCKGMTPTIM